MANLPRSYDTDHHVFIKNLDINKVSNFIVSSLNSTCFHCCTCPSRALSRNLVQSCYNYNFRQEGNLQCIVDLLEETINHVEELLDARLLKITLIFNLIDLGF